jgi:hypothetical protein
MGVSRQIHATAALSLGKKKQYPLDRRLHGPRAGLDAVMEKIPAPAENRIPLLFKDFYRFVIII